MYLQREDMSCEGVPVFDKDPIQLGMPSPWHVTVCSMILQCSRKHGRVFVERVLTSWPNPSVLSCVSLSELERVLYRGSNRKRVARNLIKLCQLWHTDRWRDLRDLPGVGVYVADCVSLFCMNHKVLCGDDRQLKSFLEATSDECTR